MNRRALDYLSADSGGEVPFDRNYVNKIPTDVDKCLTGGFYGPPVMEFHVVSPDLIVRKFRVARLALEKDSDVLWPWYG